MKLKIFTLFLIISSCQKKTENSNPLGLYYKNKVWDKKNIIVCWKDFEPKDAKYRDIVRTQIEETWQKYSSLTFLFWGKCGIGGGSDIYISVKDKKPTSPIGTDYKKFGRRMYLNFSFENFASQSFCAQSEQGKVDCIKHYSVHEFGHAIGIDHEHNRDDKPESCTREDPKKRTPGDTKVGAYDPHSVMNYCNASASLLSPGDIETVREIYGP